MIKIPEKEIDWDYFEKIFSEYFRGMSVTPQDKIYHAEGDVLTHIKMVAHEMIDHPRWTKFSTEEKAVLFLSAILHDIGKIYVTKVEDNGRISSKGHSLKGDLLIRQSLYKLGVPPHIREQVCKMALFHQVPYHIFKYENCEKKMREMATMINLDLLSFFVECDNLGRISPGQKETIEAIELFREYGKELGCFNKPYNFVSDLARFEYFRLSHRIDLTYSPIQEFSGEVIMLCGLPGSGKDYWANNSSLPMVSLDEIRVREKLSFEGNQGVVISKGKEACKEYMRKGESFVFNATNVVRNLRSQWIDLFCNYNYRVKIVYIEVPYEKLMVQNNNRSNRVPYSVYEKLMAKWQVPDITEAHEVVYSYGE